MPRFIIADADPIRLGESHPDVFEPWVDGAAFCDVAAVIEGGDGARALAFGLASGWEWINTA